MAFRNLPIYELEINKENEGIFCISLVDNPAMSVKWQKFSAQEKPLQFSVTDEEQHKVLAVIARCEFPIYRRDESGEFYVVFTKDTIEYLAQKLLNDGFQNRINIQHTEDSFVQGVKMEQMFIKNTDAGIDPKGFEEVADGSLMGLYKIENEDIWKEIKAGTFNGVSLEGYFEMVPREEKAIDSIEELLDYLGIAR